MKRAVTIAFFMCANTLAQDSGANTPSTLPTTTPSSVLSTKYDRFKDQTVVLLIVHDELGMAIAYNGQHRKGWAERAVLLGGQGHRSRPSGVIFLADGKRVPLKAVQDSATGDTAIMVDFDVLEGLSRAKRLEAAVFYGDDRAELTFDDEDLDCLRQFIAASGYDSPEALTSRNRARDAAAARLRTLQLVTAPKGAVEYVLDASGAMLTGLPAAKEVLLQSIQSLGPTQTFGITANKENVPRFDACVATHENKQKAMQFIEGISAEGAHVPPLQAFSPAFLAKPQSIIYVSNLCIERDSGELGPFLSQAQANAIPINVVVLALPSPYSDDDRLTAALIAVKSGGALFNVNMGAPGPAVDSLAPGLDPAGDSAAK